MLCRAKSVALRRKSLDAFVRRLILRIGESSDGAGIGGDSGMLRSRRFRPERDVTIRGGMCARDCQINSVLVRRFELTSPLLTQVRLEFLYI
jgi:hypothetical protein